MISFSKFIKLVELNEGKKEYLAKYSNEPDITDVINKFWIIKPRLNAPENDIDYWIKKPYLEFKNFVINYINTHPNVNQTNRQLRHVQYDKYAKEAEKYGAKMLGYAGDYEVWYIPSYEASVQIGRFYKGIWAKWCISSENSDYFYNNYGDYEFIFMVLSGKNPEVENFNKIALQLYDSDGFTYETIWDQTDEGYSDLEYDETLKDTNIPKYVEQAIEMFNDSGLTRDKYIEQNAIKLANDREWIKKTLFEDHPELVILQNSTYRVNYTAKWLNYIIEDDNVDFVKNILNYDYFENFYSDDVPSFGNMDDAEKIFNNMLKPYNITWSMIEDIYKGLDVNIDSAIQNWIDEHLIDDFSEGQGYAACYNDCQIDGMGNDARESIIKQLKDRMPFLKEIKLNDQLLLVCEFTKEDLIPIIKKFLKIESNEDPITLSLYDDYNELEKIEIEEPYYGWSGFNENMMIEAIKSFAKRLIGFITMQKDIDGQMYFDFDKVDNPENI